MAKETEADLGYLLTMRGGKEHRAVMVFASALQAQEAKRRIMAKVREDPRADGHVHVDVTEVLVVGFTQAPVVLSAADAELMLRAIDLSLG